ncbi:MAG TPA: ParA family protein [Pirellulaceae bacterium]
MARIVCIAGQAAGIGKTTTSVHLGVGLAWAGKSTVIVDWDPSRGSALHFGWNPPQAHAWAVGSQLVDALQTTASEELRIISGRWELDGAEAVDAWSDAECRAAGQRLARELADFEYVLIDCPSALNGFTESALWAATDVMLPIRCDYGALDHVPELVQTVRRMLQTPGKELDFSGVFLTHYDRDRELAGELESRVREFFGEIVFETVIPHDGSFVEAARRGQSIWEWDPRARGTRAYQELCMEVLGR